MSSSTIGTSAEEAAAKAKEIAARLISNATGGGSNNVTASTNANANANTDDDINNGDTDFDYQLYYH